MDSAPLYGAPTRTLVARLVTEQRRLAGLTQEELAERTGLSTRAISDLERGRVDRPRRRTVEALASALEPTGGSLLKLLAPDGPAADPEQNASVPDWFAGRPHPLPRVPADLTGRDAELDRIYAQIGQCPCATAVVAVLGPPGAGKTVLATLAAHRVADRFPDGTYFLDLHGSGPDPVAPGAAAGQLLRALGVPASPPDDEDRLAVYRWMMQGRQALLVLDDVVDEAQIRPLLPNSQGSLVLITSRRVLSGLESVARIVLDGLAPAAAVQLLGLIAGPDRVGAEPEAALRIAELCDWLPLALRIAGNRLADRPDWPLARLERLLRDPDRRLSALTAGDLDVRGAFASSYAGLAPTARAMFRGLGLLPGSVVTVAAAAAASGMMPELVEVQLESLVDARILRNTASGDYLLPELLRLFARELLITEDTADAEQHIPAPRHDEAHIQDKQPAP